ncbi:unnamed protein product [Rodentolepis nana]|uniref:B30.2/SPRY domain-containing protein n=1 Tax=Rodentolepis nana TaxID=102285 RepID=A0A158QJ92_RODNA|nr:unnamed protein product [Rodentolepis nana]
MTPVASRKGAGFRAPCASIEDTDSIKNGYQPSGGSNSVRTHESSMLMEDQYAPLKSVPDSPGAVLANAAMNYNAKSSSEWNSQTEKKIPPVTPRMPRPELSRQHWQMSPADCTQGLGMDLYGTDVATMMDAGWQGSRTNRGIKGAGNYYYEISVLEDGDIRIGWSTNDASLMLGMDARGYGYGAAENGDGSYAKQSTMGRLVHNGEAHEMGFPATVSNVIGCFLQLQPNPDGEGLEGNVMWSHNGQLVTSPHANLVRIPPELATNSAFFPNSYIIGLFLSSIAAISLRDARISLNFGDKPFVHPPEQISGGRVQWTSPINVPVEKIVQNVNSGWRVNQFDTTSSLNLIVSEDGRMVQATDNEWQGFRANKASYGHYYIPRLVNNRIPYLSFLLIMPNSYNIQGVFEVGKYYYEVEIVEDCGYARVGWSLPTANLQLGVDNLGYGYGCGPDGSSAKKVFNGVAEDYGVVSLSRLLGFLILLLCFNTSVTWSHYTRLLNLAAKQNIHIIKLKEFSFPTREAHVVGIKVGDVVGCFLDLDNGTIQWSVNGEMLPPAYHMDSSFISHEKTIFFPSASLYCTTLEVNYGDRPFKYQPAEEWYPLFAAADECVKDSPKWPFDINKLRQPHHSVAKGDLFFTKRRSADSQSDSDNKYKIGGYCIFSSIKATTERVESDILRPDVTITVSPNSSQFQFTQPPDSTPSEDTRNTGDTSGVGGKYSSEDEDTVIDTRDEQEKSRGSPTPHSTNRTDTQRVTEESNPEITVEYYTNAEGQRVKKIIKKQRRIVTTVHKESVERYETTVRNAEQEPTNNNNTNDEEARMTIDLILDLNKAINFTTQLDSESVVVNGSTGIQSDTDLTSPASGRTPL